jgi:hypothetical protein
MKGLKRGACQSTSPVEAGLVHGPLAKLGRAADLACPIIAGPKNACWPASSAF